MGIEQLENKGFAFLNTENINAEKRQIVVVGSARGGTSLVAGALHHLGVFTGEKSNAPVFEDVLLSEAFETGDIKLAKEISTRYTSEHDVWTWKRPGALNYLDKVEEVIPNPFYVFIFKDIFAIANRNSISMQADITKGLSNALRDYGKIVDFVSKTSMPMMLVSAEKALQNKCDFVTALIELNKDIIDLSDREHNALNFITPNPKDYLDKTRKNKTVAHIDEINSKFVKGWAFYAYNNESPLIELYINGELTDRKVVTILRDKLKESGQHPTGVCGFEFAVSDYGIEKLCTISVKVQDEIDYIGSWCSDD